MDLLDLGWTYLFVENSETLDVSKLARISAIHRSHIEALSVNGELNLYLSGKYLSSGLNVIGVGDWCEVSPPFIDEQNKPSAIIVKLLPRYSKISRVVAGIKSDEQVMAANIHYAFIVTSVNKDFNMNRLHRYIVVAKEGGVQPVIILSKIDLNNDYSELVEKINKQFPNIDILPTSILSKIGIGKIREYFTRGVTGVFLGSSGVGKSSLVNELLETSFQLTKNIREDDDKGRHTTTSRQLFFIPSGGMIIDTPGLRELQIFGDVENVRSTFKDIENFSYKCKFKDCTHTVEPGCSVLKALKNGELEEEVYSSYNKLVKEVEYSNRKMDKKLAANQKRKWKNITKSMRVKKKLENK
ncbi:MAG: ribosome small subunit-dependent GTPase A [Bdellovibrionales bacterium]|nr:ribosome small subunit-dependent GTPase A [Bdellovibrionales bacterium]